MKRGPKSDGKHYTRRTNYVLKSTDSCLNRLSKERGFKTIGKLLDAIMAKYITPEDEK